MKELDQVIEDVFKMIKTQRNVSYKKLYEIEDANQKIVQIAWTKLSDDYGLVSSIGGVFTLTTEGEKHKDVNSYLKSIKKQGLDWYRVIPITLTVIFGLSTIYFANKNFNQRESHFLVKKEADSLRIQISSCNSQLLARKDELTELMKQIELSKIQKPKPTLQTKN